MSKALLVAFHFPPLKASSGLERTLAMVRHLPAHGWEPLVLTASRSAYPATSEERMAALPEAAVIERAFALDAGRHLAWRGRYPGWLALPDRWLSWALGAVPLGLAMIRRHRPQVIWTTYPITTAHYIGALLHRFSGIPWIADFRDPMVERDERRQVWMPERPALRRLRLAAEASAVRRAAALTFCTEGAREICAGRYPQADPTRLRVIANGFDESAFAGLAAAEMKPAEARQPITLVHSGTIYPTLDRDPTHFLQALGRVRQSRPPDSRPLRVVLRGSGVERLYTDLLVELGLADCVEFAPLTDYASALAEMLSADGLLLFQGYTSNPAIPAKLYEYFRAGRPILALADSAGDTARCLREAGVGVLVPLDDTERIGAALMAFVASIEDSSARGMTGVQAVEFERGKRVQGFARLFNEVAG